MHKIAKLNGVAEGYTPFAVDFEYEVRDETGQIKRMTAHSAYSKAKSGAHTGMRDSSGSSASGAADVRLTVDERVALLQ